MNCENCKYKETKVCKNCCYNWKRLEIKKECK